VSWNRACFFVTVHEEAVRACHCACRLRRNDPGRWQIQPGENVYRCVRLTVPQDLYITSIRAQTAVGMHHAVLSFAGGNGTEGADGPHDCTSTNIGALMLYASSVGTETLELPRDVGLAIHAGQQLHLNLHLLDAADEPLAGETSIWIKAQESPPPVVLTGPLAIEIPPDRQPHTVTGECTATQPYSLFAVWPHTHTFATHQTIEHVRGDSASVVQDRDFDFEHQTYYDMNPLAAVQTGDKLRVTCTYTNTSETVITYGDGPAHEMCFAGLYRFPASGSNQYCPN
jgi:hypothetical protein